MKDYYKILELTPTADKKEIKKAFRRLARKYHPDLNPGDAAAAEKFKLINEACQVLSDENKRARYDLDYQKKDQRAASKAGRQQAQKHSGGPTPFGPDFGKAFSQENFEKAFFGGMKNEAAKGRRDKKDPLDTSELFQRFFGFS
ncbi:MAG: DnaJ domain-containing protein [Selenomonas sp.]|uniref:DnaJ domain-containing protein n=1 Tax=Selenomonas sp. TaxID=2053611 RepID=UPI0025D3FD71|nr:DnaJ domain-containing protein [Selenomonas sp.]MCR5439376.1 DnaJ domain-containing protein [Selenomonas sp.]